MVLVAKKSECCPHSGPVVKCGSALFNLLYPANKIKSHHRLVMGLKSFSYTTGL